MDSRERTRVEDIGRREELAEFLRARRAELQPEDVGLQRRGRRRVSGLRRHEVADLAAVSVTWYTWLEQARDFRVSAHALDSLCRALRFDEETWKYVRRLADLPVVQSDPAPVEADESLCALLDDLLPDPAYITTGPFDFLAWNAAYVALFGDPGELDAGHRNALWAFFMTPEVRDRVRDWKDETQQAVDRLRAEAAKYPGDRRFRDVIDALSEASPDFRAAWNRRQVGRFVGHVQTVDHPDVGTVRAQLIQLRPLDHPALTVMVHRPADDASRQRLAALLSSALVGG